MEEDIKRVKRYNICACITMFVHITALYSVKAYFSLIASDLGAVDYQLSVPVFCYSIFQVFIALPMGRFVDKHGPRIPVTLGLIMDTIGVLILSYAKNWYMVALCGFFMGIGNTGIIIGGQGVSMAGGKGQKTANRVGLIMLASACGQFVGPYIGGWIMDYLTWSRFWLMGILSAFGIVFALMLSNEGANKKKDEGKMLQSIKILAKAPNVLLAVGTSAIVLFTQETIVTYFPLYADGIGFSAVAIGTILAARGIASMVVRPLIAVASRKFSLKGLTVAVLIGGGLSVLLFALVQNFYVLVVISALAGAFLGFSGPLTLTLLATYAPKEHHGQAISLRVVCNYGGQSASALIFGALSTFMGFAPVFWISSALMVGYGVLAKAKLKE